MFGVVQLATTAFYQISADGASFVAAHDTVASVGDPTSANLSSAKASVGSAFSHIVGSSISVLNPSNSTFETDVSQQVPGISALGNPAALTITSRLVEGSSTSGSAPSPLMNCTQSTLNIVNNANAAVISSAPVGLLQANSLLTTMTVGSTNALQFNAAPLTSRVTTLSGLSTDLTSTITQLTLLPHLLSAIPLIGTILSPLTNAIGTDLEAPLAAAMSGTFSATSAVSTIDAQLSAQVSLITPFLGAINAVLTTPTTGLLASNGPLAAVNADFKALQTIDASAAKCS